MAVKRISVADLMMPSSGGFMLWHLRAEFKQIEHRDSLGYVISWLVSGDSKQRLKTD